MKTEKIKVFLSDPQILFREGIHFTLSGEEDFEVTGETTSNEEALDSVEANVPNIAILNMKSGKVDGPTATCRIKRNFPSIAVILVEDNPDDEKVFNAIKCGASACINKDTEPEKLVSLIREVAGGGQPIIEALLSPTLASKALETFKSLASLSEQVSNLLARLSPKETEVLSAIAAGGDIKQVAAKLSSNEETVRRYLRLVASKLVTNEQTWAVIETTQRTAILPPALSGRQGADYITKDEFSEFKESLKQHLKVLGEIV